jgi:hypothetical protein
MKKKMLVLILGTVFSLVLAGCNYPGQTTPTSQVDMLNTAAAQTIQAQQTSIAQTSQAFEQPATPTATLEPSEVPAEETEEPSEPTSAPAPTNTPLPQPTATAKVACDVAAFVSETIPDGTDFTPGKAFTKTWTLKNVGSCTWNQDYDVVFVDGTAMNAPAAQQLTTGTVKPGETVKISIDMKAPLAGGTHRGDFKLRNANGAIFGIGDGNKTFWVKIDVIGTVYDFTKNACASGVTWKSGAGTLPCPTNNTNDTRGWIEIIQKPVLENGYVDDEPGLKVMPEMVDNGWIKGIFPEITVTEGVYFKSIIGCYGEAKCDVKFKLDYKVDGGSEKTLASWHEVQDEQFNRVKVDLSSLAGKKVQFILLVEANGSYKNDRALWFGPIIEP